MWKYENWIVCLEEILESEKDGKAKIESQDLAKNEKAEKERKEWLIL